MLTKAIVTDLEVLVDVEGKDYKATLDQVKAIKNNLRLLEQATKEMAVEDGLAYFKQVTIKEHIRKEHEQTRFYWNAQDPLAELAKLKLYNKK